MIKDTYNNLKEELEHKKLIIFGCGLHFQRFCETYISLLDKIEVILDNNYEQESVYLEQIDIRVPVVRPEKIKGWHMEQYAVLFCCRAGERRDAMEAQLDAINSGEYSKFYTPIYEGYNIFGRQNIKNVIVNTLEEQLDCFDLHDRILQVCGSKSLSELKDQIYAGKKVIIPGIVIILTSRCTLRCKHCVSMMWAFQEKVIDVPLEEICESLSRILEAVDCVVTVSVVGGEPLLADSFAGVMNFLLGQEKVLSVDITTNGTVPIRDEWIPLLNKENVKVLISSYEHIVNQDAFVKSCATNGINYSLERAEKWIDFGSMEQRNCEEDRLRFQYERCIQARRCKTMWGDRLYACTISGNLGELGKISGVSLKISQSTDLRKDLWEFYLTPNIKACDYCEADFADLKFVPVAEQLER